MSGRTKAGTGASTAGLLPDTVGVVLLGTVIGTILTYGSEFGYPTRPLALIVASGIAAALGVRIAAADRSGHLVAGVTILWLSALAFTGGTVLLVVRQVPSGIVPTVTVLVVASAALLGPFGIVSNTIRTYGHGTGSAILRRYLIGTLLLVVLVGGFGALSLLRLLGLEFVLAPLPGASELLSTLDSLPARVVVATAVYAGAFVALPWAVRSFPAEVFVRVSDFDRLTAAHQSARAISHYGIRLVFAYFVVAVPTAIVSTHPQDLLGSEGGAVGVLLALAEPITRVGASRTAIVAVGSATVLVVAGLVSLGRLRGIRTVSGAAVAETVLPPATLFALLLGSATVFADRLPLATVEPQLAAFADPGSPVYEVIAGSPGLISLGLGTLAILTSGLVLSVPVVLAGTTPGDESLVGLIASVVSLTALVVVAVFRQDSLSLILIGVGAAAIVWELGEYATVAAGELRSRGESSTLPAGFTTLLSIHTLVTLGVTAIGAAVAVGLTTIAVGATLPLTAALPAVLATVIGLAALMLLLTG